MSVAAASLAAGFCRRLLVPHAIGFVSAFRLECASAGMPCRESDRLFRRTVTSLLSDSHRRSERQVRIYITVVGGANLFRQLTSDPCDCCSVLVSGGRTIGFCAQIPARTDSMCAALGGERLGKSTLSRKLTRSILGSPRFFVSPDGNCLLVSIVSALKCLRATGHAHRSPCITYRLSPDGDFSARLSFHIGLRLFP